MPTAKDRMLMLSSLPSGVSARNHFLSITSGSTILIPEQGEIIETYTDEEILIVEIATSQIDDEILTVDFKSEEDSSTIKGIEYASSI